MDQEASHSRSTALKKTSMENAEYLDIPDNILMGLSLEWEGEISQDDVSDDILMNLSLQPDTQKEQGKNFALIMLDLCMIV